MPPELLQEIPTGGDPFLDALKWIVIAVTLILVFGTSILTYIKNSKQGTDPVEHAKDDAEIMLYSQLQEQLKRMDDDVKELTNQKNRLFEEWAILKVKSEYQEEKLNELSKSDAIICNLRETLVEKGKEITSREKENKKLTHDILDMKDRIHHLEMRLTEDEKSMCTSCPRQVKTPRKAKVVQW